jgi:GT2 family glycosyltransferase
MESAPLNILILNFNSTGAAGNCISSILASDKGIFRIILINNYSTDEDLNEIRSLRDNLRNKINIILVEIEKNLGYSGGNNAGIRYLIDNNIQGDILIMNPDVIVSADTITQMRKAMSSDTGIVTVRTKDTNGKVMFDAIKLNGFFQRRIITSSDIIATDYSQGSCMLIKRDVIDLVGMFDERFFLYWEEVDFSMRVRKAGLKLVSVTTGSIMRNRNSDSIQAGVFYYSARNARLIKEKHPDHFSSLGYLLYIIWLALISLKYIVRPGMFYRIISSYLHGLSDSMTNRYFEKQR